MEESTIISEEINTTAEITTEESTSVAVPAENCDPTVASDTSSAEENTEKDIDKNKPAIDYHELARRDVESLRSEFPELAGLSSITELENPMRYAALRDMGLEPREAYLATTRRVRKPDTRSHLISAAPKSVHTPKSSMYGEELSNARALFSDMTDSEIQNLYRKVTK